MADPSWIPALAGLAWVLAALGRHGEAAKVLTAVPPPTPYDPRR